MSTGQHLTWEELGATPTDVQVAAVEAAGWSKALDRDGVAGEGWEHPDHSAGDGEPVTHSLFGAYRTLFAEAGLLFVPAV